MSVTLMDGSPDDFWSEKDEAAFRMEIDSAVRRVFVAPPVGYTGLLGEIVFDTSCEVDEPIEIGKDPYKRAKI